MQERIPEPGPEEGSYYRLRPSDLRPLVNLPDWQVARGEPNIRGWVVYDEDNTRPLGSVEDLLVSIDMREAVFIILNTGDVIGDVGVDYYGSDSRLTDRRILVPLDRIALDKPDCRVLYLDTLDQLQNAPEFQYETRDFGPYYDYWQRA